MGDGRHRRWQKLLTSASKAVNPNNLQGAVDDITLEEAKPDGFGRSADPVATQPQLQAAEAQHWATMQQRMQVRLSRVAPCTAALDA